MNTLYTITINSRKYVTTDKNEAAMFSITFNGIWHHKDFINKKSTTETIPNVIAV